jgi:hypothetical protein
MSKAVVSNRVEAKARQVELAWRKREEMFKPKVSKEYAWDNFEKLREKALGY